MNKTTNRKKEGFQGQKAIVIPRKVLSRLCVSNDITKTLYITDIGYYPNARFHYRERPAGADQHILVYCHEGKGKAQIEGVPYEVQAGDFFFVPAKMAHRYEADENNPWTIYWVHFKGSISDSIIALMEKHAQSKKGFIHHPDKALALFNEIYAEMERGYGIDHLIYANMCFAQYLATFIYNDKYHPNGRLKQKTEVEIAIDFLTQRVDQVLSLEDIAGAVNLSPSHFSVVFKKKTGFSPIEYFNHMKVQKACQYLLFTHLRIKEIALELGIADPYYFSRLFTKIMGMSPNEYREARKLRD